MRLNLVDIVADRIDRCANGLRRQFGASAFCQNQLGPVEEKTRRTAFIHFDMRFFMADYRSVGRDHGGEREAVRCGPGACPEYRAWAAEQLRKPVVQRRAQPIAVIGRIGLVGGLEGVPDRRVHCGCIVGEKQHRNPLDRGTLLAQKGNFRTWKTTKL